MAITVENSDSNENHQSRVRNQHSRPPIPSTTGGVYPREHLCETAERGGQRPGYRRTSSRVARRVSRLPDLVTAPYLGKHVELVLLWRNENYAVYHSNASHYEFVEIVKYPPHDSHSSEFEEYENYPCDCVCDRRKVYPTLEALKKACGDAFPEIKDLDQEHMMQGWKRVKLNEANDNN